MILPIIDWLTRNCDAIDIDMLLVNTIKMVVEGFSSRLLNPDLFLIIATSTFSLLDMKVDFIGPFNNGINEKSK